MESIWHRTAKMPTFEPLAGDRHTDVLIIGGGITGILCAYMLRQAGVDCILVEADRICRGVTGDTTAKVTIQHGLVYDKLIRTLGEEKAGLYLRANSAALDWYKAYCTKVDCGWREQDAYVYATEDKSKIEAETAAYQRLGVNAETVTDLPLPVPTVGAVKVPGQGMFHPLKFLSSVAQDLPICENTKVMGLRPGVALTNHGAVRAEKIVIATHFPFLNKHGFYFAKLYQHRSYVISLKNAGTVEGMYVDQGEKGLSFRSQGDLLLLGGGSHRTGKQGGNWQELTEFAAMHYPKAEVVDRWATQDCMSLDHIPYIGPYAKTTPNLYVATGYNKWGMTSSAVAAGILCDLVQGRANPWAEVFDPSRSVWHPQLAMNVAHSLLGLLTPTVPRCPHLGCALHYNKAEHSWDCSCHGSRFSKEGKLLQGPATDDKKL